MRCRGARAASAEGLRRQSENGCTCSLPLEGRVASRRLAGWGPLRLSPGFLQRRRVGSPRCRDDPTRPLRGHPPLKGEGALKPPTTTTTRLTRRASGTVSAPRMVPEETPVALSYAGTTHAVMMASPADLDDFAFGFSLTEGIIKRPEEIESIGVEEVGPGIDIQIRLKDSANTRFEARRRRLAGPVGCGLCGIESIDEAMRAVREVGAAKLNLADADIVQSVRLLSKRQPFHAETGAVHAAGFYIPSKGIVAAREDVGRHNALDKLAGALAKAGRRRSVGRGRGHLARVGGDGAEDGGARVVCDHCRLCAHRARRPNRRCCGHDPCRAGSRRGVRHIHSP